MVGAVVPGQVVLGCVREQAEQAMGTNQPSASCMACALTATLTSLSDGL